MSINQAVIIDRVLREVALEDRPRSFSERRITQAIVYLSQACGLPLGYSFAWYARGPYSPDLNEALVATSGLRGVDVKRWAGVRLSDEARGRLQIVRRLITPPGSIDRGAWCETLSAMHHLLRVERRSREEARTRLMRYRADLGPYADLAIDALSRTRALARDTGED